MSTSIQDYRAYFSQQTVPAHTVTEGLVEASVAAASLQNQPLGTYYYIAEAAWTPSSADGYILLRIERQGVAGPQLGTRAVAAGVLTQLIGFGEFEVTNGNIDIDLRFEAPAQSGNGNGVIEQTYVAWWRVLEEAP